MMTKRERAGRDQIAKKLAQDGYPTYASIFELFDLHLTKDPSVIGYMVPEQAIICVNENLDIDQVGMVVRHEILHEFLEHHKRAQAYDPKGDHETFNEAGDYEISNLGYTERDKQIARAIRLGDQVLRGLVTDYDHPDWTGKTFEEMYDLLKKLKKEDPQAQRQPRIGDRGNQQIQDAEDAQRRAERVSNQAQQDIDQANKQAGSSPGSGSDSEDGQSDQDGSGQGGKDQKDKTDKDGSGDDSSNKKGRNRYDDEEYSKMSPEEKKRERARRRKEAAKKLKEQADNLIDQLQDVLNEGKSGKSDNSSDSGNPGNSSDVFDTPEEKKDKAERIAKIKRLLRNLETAQAAKDESQTAKHKEKAVKAAKDAAKYRDSALTRFTESFNKFIKDSIARSRNDSWSHINKKYVNSGLLRPGKSWSARGPIPLINVYFDRSSSWDAAKTEKGRQAISTMNKYVVRGEIKMNLYYFNSSVHDKDPGGGGTNGQPILEHIQQTKPNNVIILTDNDISDCKSNITVPGAVWFLWYDTDHNMIADHLSGARLTREFRVE